MVIRYVFKVGKVNLRSFLVDVQNMYVCVLLLPNGWFPYKILLPLV